MNDFMKAVRMLIAALCVALFGMGIIWNLFYGTTSEETLVAAGTMQESQTEEEAASKSVMAQPEPARETVLFTEWNEATDEQIKESDTAMENQLAALRMERDSSWAQLLQDLDSLQFAEKEQYLKQQAELQFKEQRVELLLWAKGIPHCLVLLEPEQANVIVAEAVLAEQYEKIYDLVQRNTSYAPEQIVLIPLHGDA